jgi:sulfide:quinone oxidoreductase
MSGPLRVTIAGGGVAALEAALALQELAGNLVSVELVAPETEFAYRPLAVAEPFRVGEMHRFPLARLAEAAGAALRTGSAAAVDPERKVLKLDDGTELPYDALVLALGARAREAIPGALTFRGPEDGPSLAGLLDRVTAGDVQRIVFAAPAAVTWPLPLYELALLTAEYVAERGTRGIELVLATPEDRPLALFGENASDAVRELLELRGIALETGVAPLGWSGGTLQLAGDRWLEADAVVALPRLEGPSLAGVPSDNAGFIPTDEYGWVLGVNDVYAAGDSTQFPVKQGGLATQQADAVASVIAADAGAPVKPATFRPVLRGLLLTGLTPRFLRAETGTGRSVVDTEPLWWPPAKVVGRYLAPFLADHLGLEPEPPAQLREGAVPVEVELDPSGRPNWSHV